MGKKTNNLIGISYSKFIKYFITFFIICSLVLLLLFTIRENNPYNKVFKDNWNTIYIEKGEKGIDDYITNNNLNIQKAEDKKECNITGFYNEAGNLFFCRNDIIYFFKIDNNIKLINNKKEVIIKLFVYSLIITFVYTFIILIFYPRRFLSVKDEIGIDEANNTIKGIDKKILGKIESGSFDGLDGLSKELFSYSLVLLKNAPQVSININIIYNNILGKLQHLDKNIYNSFLLDHLEIKNYTFFVKGDYKNWILSELNLLFSKNGYSFGIYIINVFFIILYIAIMNTYIFTNYVNIYDGINKTFNLMLGQNNTFVINNIIQSGYISLLYIIGLVLKIYMILIFIKKS